MGVQMKFIFCLLFLASVSYGKQIPLQFDLNRGLQGWVAQFADYTRGQRDFYELRAGLRHLPQEISSMRSGYMISGNNHSDDLYMYLYRKLSRVNGLMPLTKYNVNYEITFDSNAPTGCVWGGGGPGG
jgi:hypothetical protein